MSDRTQAMEALERLGALLGSMKSMQGTTPVEEPDDEEGEIPSPGTLLDMAIMQLIEDDESSNKRLDELAQKVDSLVKQVELLTKIIERFQAMQPLHDNGSVSTISTESDVKGWTYKPDPLNPTVIRYDETD